MSARAPGLCLCDDVGGDGYAFCVACTKRRADDDAVQAGLTEIGRGIDAVLGRERRLRKTLAALVEYLDYSGDLAQTRDEACNCPLDANDTQCGICLGRNALAKARELLR